LHRWRCWKTFMKRYYKPSKGLTTISDRVNFIIGWSATTAPLILQALDLRTHFPVNSALLMYLLSYHEVFGL
jgi:hypothetical protein